MDIKKYYSIFFKDFANGIILDNSYNVYNRNRYIDYIEKNEINYIYSQDIDMNMVAFFPKIKFLSVPQDAENLYKLYQLENLIGLEIFASEIDKIELNNFKYLEMLLVRGKPKNLINIQHCKNLRVLSCQQWNLTDLYELSNIKTLISLEMFFCNNLKTLKGIECLTNLEEICLNYCLKLREIGSLEAISKNIKTLKIFDCNNIENLSVFNSLQNLQRLIFLSTGTKGNKIDSIGFVEKMHNLQEFVTNYKIIDKNLKPLVNVKEVEILKFYKDYNMTENDFERIVN